MRAEITPKNILMIGPTAWARPRFARRLAKLADAPFIRSRRPSSPRSAMSAGVDSIVRDLVDMAVKQERESAMRRHRSRAEDAAETASATSWCPSTWFRQFEQSTFGLAPACQTRGRQHARQVMRKRLREGLLADKEIRDRGHRPEGLARDHGPAGHGGNDRATKGPVREFGGAKKRLRKLRIAEAHKLLIDEEAAKLVNDDEVRTAALANAGRTASSSSTRSTRSRPRSERAARRVAPGRAARLLPLVEAPTVNTKYGMIKTDHMLFIRVRRVPPQQAQRLIPELQGRFPDRVELGFAQRRRTSKRS